MSDDPRDEEGFLARWSRRKREARAVETSDPPPAPDAVPNADPPPAAPPAPVASCVEAPAEAPALPPIETLTPASDFTPFLRAGVPAALRNAALRKLWADPAIRDAVGPARDYAWDWHVPGGVPGGGPAPGGEEIRALLAQLRGDAPAADGPAAPAAAPPPAPAVDPVAAPPAGDCSRVKQSAGPTPAPPGAGASPAPAPAGSDPPAPARRHGGATPA